MKEHKVTVSVPSRFWDFVVASGVVLVVLKLCGFIEADWVYVLIPFWIVAASVGITLLIVLLMLSFVGGVFGWAALVTWWERYFK